jgi:hypothetical protein
MKSVAPIAILVLLLTAAPALANSVIQCHCFQDRSLDPSQPSKVDPYLLATTQNSFLASTFGVSRSQVVRKRMSGTPAEELWIAYSLGEKTGTHPDTLQGARRAEGSWKGVLVKGGHNPDSFGALIAAALQSGSDQTLADAIADETVSRHLKIERSELEELRTRGASTQEVVLAAFLSERAGRPAVAIWSEVNGGETSWGLVASNLGVELNKMEEEFNRLKR